MLLAMLLHMLLAMLLPVLLPVLLPMLLARYIFIQKTWLTLLKRKANKS